MAHNGQSAGRWTNMDEIFVQSQWDTLLAFLRQGQPALWVLLALVNGWFLAVWCYAKLARDRPLRPATIHIMRALILTSNVAVVFRDDTLRLIRPFLRYFI